MSKKQLVVAVCLVVVFFSANGVGWAGCNPHQQRQAESAMASLKQMAKIYNDGDMLVVEWDYGWPDLSEGQKWKLLRAVADSDYCLTGRARSIFYYFPAGHLVGKANKLVGIRLLEK